MGQVAAAEVAAEAAKERGVLLPLPTLLGRRRGECAFVRVRARVGPGLGLGQGQGQGLGQGLGLTLTLTRTMSRTLALNPSP